MTRGEVWWASPPAPRGSEPGLRKPVVNVQADAFNRSRIRTLIVAAVTASRNLAGMPGNVRLRRKEGGLREVSVVNVSQVLTIDKDCLVQRLGSLSGARMTAVDSGLRLALSL